MVDLYLMNPDGSGRVKADLGANTDVYLARVDWLPDVERADRPAPEPRPEAPRRAPRRRPQTGASTLLFSDTSDLWINLSDDLKPLKDGSILFSSERSGYRQLLPLGEAARSRR